MSSLGLEPSVERDANVKYGSLARLAVYFDEPAMSLDDPLCDGQAQSRSALFPMARFIGSPEAIENVREIFFSDSDSGIRDGCHRKAGARFEADLYGASRRRIFGGIINQNEQRAAQGIGIGFNLDSPEEVNDWHRRGVEAGGQSIEDPPGYRENAYGKLYLAYLRDPDGNKLCRLHRPEQ